MVGDNQIRRLRRMLQQGKTLQQSADAVGIAVNNADISSQKFTLTFFNTNTIQVE